MPDDNQIPNPKSQIPSTQDNQGQAQPFDQTQGTPVVPSPPAQPVSVPAGKETVPLSIPKPQEQWVEETAKEAKLEAELQEAGVEAVKGDVLEVAPEVQDVGVVATGTAVPLPTEPTLKLPMTEEKAKGILRMHKKVRDSITWLAMLVIRQFQLLRFRNKKG